ncbi:MAG: tandem-95 repeat protein, partial [Erysipelothrix sp.]|nr:tandem-95 repeat protein [Erysipelothrix sp.]
GELYSEEALVRITINPDNDPPVADDDSFVVDEGGVHNDTATGFDPEGMQLEFILVSGTVNGSLTFNADGTYTYTHNGSETTSDSFTFKVNDGDLDSNVATVSIEINPVNDPPVANDDSFTTNEGGIHSHFVTGSDPESDELEFILISGPVNGILTFNSDGTYTYTHNGSETTSDSFTFKVNDGELDSNVATVTITIIPVNEPPVALNDAFEVDQGESKDGFVVGTDPEDDELGFVLVNAPLFGTLVFNTDGTYTYTHDNSENFEDVFTFKVNDGEFDSNIASVTILINATLPDDNEAPMADDSEFEVDQGEAYNGLVTGSDPDGDEITFILVDSPAFGTLTFNPDGTYTYTHDDSENYDDSFTFKVFDGDVESDVATVTILINATLPDTSDNNSGLLGYGALLMGLLLWFVSKKKETHK